MIDHLLRFDDRASAVAALAPLGLAPGGDLDLSRCILNIGGPNEESVRVIEQDAVWDRSGPDDPRNWTITTPEVLAEGFFVIVALPGLSPELRDLPGYACRIVTDRDAAVAGSPDFMLFVTDDPTFDHAALSTDRVEPTPAGSRYPFGN